MHILYSLPLDRSDRPANARSWNDPIRALYPHHRELWPAEIPEHVHLQRLSLRLARKRRRLKVVKFLRWLSGPAAAFVGPAGRPRLQGKARPDAVSLPLAAGGCHADCR